MRGPYGGEVILLASLPGQCDAGSCCIERLQVDGEALYWARAGVLYRVEK